MRKYKSKCRFTFLIFINGTILEIFPSQIIETEDKLDHPNLIEIKDVRKTV